MRVCPGDHYCYRHRRRRRRCCCCYDDVATSATFPTAISRGVRGGMDRRRDPNRHGPARQPITDLAASRRISQTTTAALLAGLRPQTVRARPPIHTRVLQYSVFPLNRCCSCYRNNNNIYLSRKYVRENRVKESTQPPRSPQKKKKKKNRKNHNHVNARHHVHVRLFCGFHQDRRRRGRPNSFDGDRRNVRATDRPVQPVGRRRQLCQPDRNGSPAVQRVRRRFEKST